MVPYAVFVALWATASVAAAQRPQPGLSRLPAAPAVAETRFVEWVTLGVDPRQPLPMVIALHAMGAGPAGAVRAFERGFSCPVRLVAPRGWVRDYGPGFSWFRSHAEDRAAGRFQQGVQEASVKLGEFTKKIVEVRPTVGKPIVTGFSQGAHVVYGLVQRGSSDIALAIPVSGQLPESMWQFDDRNTVPLVALHGRRDRVVDFGVTQSMFVRASTFSLPWSLRVDPKSGHRFSAFMQREVAKLVEAHLQEAGHCPRISAP